MPPLKVKHGVDALACSLVLAPGVSDVLVTTTMKGVACWPPG